MKLPLNILRRVRTAMPASILPTAPRRKERGKGEKARAKARKCAERRGEWCGGMTIYIHMQLVSEMNEREHFMARHRRKKKQQKQVAEHFMVFGKGLARTMNLPVAVTLTRIGGKPMDKDNLHAAFKHVQDEVARQLGVDDGDESAVTWEHKQVPGGEPAIRITCNPAEAA